MRKLINFIARIFGFRKDAVTDPVNPVSADIPAMTDAPADVPADADAEAVLPDAGDEKTAREEIPAGPVPVEDTTAELVEETAEENPEEEPEEDPPAEDFIADAAPGKSNFQRRREITVDGVRYPSIRQACAAKHVGYAIVKQRLQKGWPVDKAFHTPSRRSARGSFDLAGKCRPYCGPEKKYADIKEMCAAHHVSYDTFLYRVKKGIPVTEALHPVWRDEDGRVYRSKESMCAAHHADPAVFDARIRRGWSVGDALNVPAGQSRKTYHRLTAGYEAQTEASVSEPDALTYKVDAEGFVHWE